MTDDELLPKILSLINEEFRANEEQLSVLSQGVEVWNKWREKNTSSMVVLIRSNLEGINLSKANLREVNLVSAFLNKADLNGANLYQADLFAADLSEANLSEADLIGANLHGANLHGANLSGADLIRTNLSGANLIRTNLSGSKIGSTNLLALDLSQTQGLEEVVHIYPSTIGTNTLQQSQGKLPEIFLRGCGMSDWEIEMVKLYNPDLTANEFIDIQNRIFDLRNWQALQISPLFISYSHGDSEFVNKIGNSLQDKGIRYWRDIKDLKAGRVEKQLDQAIRQNPTVLLVLSEHSLSSDWVEHEVITARELEKSIGRDLLCPVALDDSWKSSKWEKHLMEQVMKYNILDFSEWEDDVKFEGMFRKLIDGLQLFYKG